MDNNHIIDLAAIAAGVGLLIVMLLTNILTKRPRKLNIAYYEDRWKVLQKLLRDQSTWPLAIIEADKLLDHALKARKYKGKTMGERLVAAQRDIQDNDEVWFGHKLRNRLVHEHDVRLRERDMKDALLGIKHALKDLGAL